MIKLDFEFEIRILSRTGLQIPTNKEGIIISYSIHRMDVLSGASVLSF